MHHMYSSPYHYDKLILFIYQYDIILFLTLHFTLTLHRIKNDWLDVIAIRDII